MAQKFKPRFEAVGLEQSFVRKMTIAFGALAILGVLSVLIWWGRSLWDSASARRLSREGAELVATGHFDQAIPLLVQARQKAPKDANVLRNLARSCDSMSAFASEAVRCWQELSKSGQSTLDDRISQAAAMVKVSDLEGARNILAAIPESERRQVKCVEIDASILRRIGRGNEADSMLRSIWESRPDDPSCQLKLAQMDLNSPFEPLREKSQQSLWKIARHDKALAATALLALANSLPLTPSETTQIRSLIASHPEILSTERLSILGVCIKKNPQIAHELEEEESQQYADKRPEECPEYYEWLARLGDAPRILKDLAEGQPAPSGGSSKPPAVHPKAEVLRSRELCLAYVNALVIESRWNEVSAFLEIRHLPLNDFDAEILRSLCAKGLGDSADHVDDHLLAALSSARANHATWEISRVVEVCEKLGSPRIALDACSTLAGDHSVRLETLKRMFKFNQELRDADGMLRNAESIVEMNPSLLNYVEQSVYLKLITGVSVEGAMHDLEKGLSQTKAGGSSLWRLSKALALEISGNKTAASQQLDGIDPGSLPTGARAVMGGLLGSVGRRSEGYSIAEKISPSYILNEENWFRQLVAR